MELLLWIFPALAASLFSASFGFVNHHYKADGRELVLWRGFVPFLLNLPFAFFFAPPQDPLFYLYVIINRVAAFFSGGRSPQALMARAEMTMAVMVLSLVTNLHS